MAAVLAWSAVASPLSAQIPEDNFDFSIGFGYDQISQGYYLTIIDTLAIDEDSITTLKQTSEEINALRIKTSVDWTHRVGKESEINVNNLSLLSDDDLRDNLELSYKIGSLTLKDHIDVRAVWNVDAASATGYVTNSLTGKLRPRIGNGMYLVAKNSFDVVRYNGSDEFSFDYNYNRFSLGIEREFGWTDLIALTYRNDQRVVSDSTRLNYSRHRILFDFNWSPSYTFSVYLNNEVMRILSNKENNYDDGWENYLETELTVRPSLNWKFDIENRFEYAVFDSQDFVNFDYLYNTSELTVSHFPSTDLELFVKPSAAIFWSRYEEFRDQDYHQLAVEYGFDLSIGDRLWVDTSHKFGRRDYSGDMSGFYTDYILNQFNLLGDLKIYGGLSLNSIVSIDWENHDLREDDNNLSLISVGLDYRF